MPLNNGRRLSATWTSSSAPASSHTVWCRSTARAQLAAVCVVGQAGHMLTALRPRVFSCRAARTVFWTVASAATVGAGCAAEQQGATTIAVFAEAQPGNAGEEVWQPALAPTLSAPADATPVAPWPVRCGGPIVNGECRHAVDVSLSATTAGVLLDDGTVRFWGAFLDSSVFLYKPAAKVVDCGEPTRTVLAAGPTPRRGRGDPRGPD